MLAVLGVLGGFIGAYCLLAKAKAKARVACVLMVFALLFRYIKPAF